MGGKRMLAGRRLNGRNTAKIGVRGKRQGCEGAVGRWGADLAPDQAAKRAVDLSSMAALSVRLATVAAIRAWNRVFFRPM